MLDIDVSDLSENWRTYIKLYVKLQLLLHIFRKNFCLTVCQLLVKKPKNQNQSEHQTTIFYNVGKKKSSKHHFWPLVLLKAQNSTKKITTHNTDYNFFIQHNPRHRIAYSNNVFVAVSGSSLTAKCLKVVRNLKKIDFFRIMITDAKFFYVKIKIMYHKIKIKNFNPK
jgi:hypothetical protein